MTQIHTENTVAATIIVKQENGKQFHYKPLMKLKSMNSTVIA